MLTSIETNTLIDYLTTFVTPHKKALIEKVLSERTRFITVVLEDIYQSHNANAVLRSCDCFGIQDVHVIEQKNKFQANSEIALGASKWLSIHRHANTKEAFATFRKAGYQIVATSPNAKSISLADFNLTQKTALCFGTEEKGLTEEALSNADACIHIPMYGFTQSFNISVSAALCLFQLTQQLRASDLPYALTENEKNLYRLDWLTEIIPNGEIVKKDFTEKNFHHE